MCSQMLQSDAAVRCCGLSTQLRAYSIGLEPSRGLSGRMCRMSRPSGRLHDVTFAPCMFTCSRVIGIKRRSSARHGTPARPDSVIHERLVLPACPVAKKGVCHCMLSMPLEHPVCSQCCHARGRRICAGILVYWKVWDSKQIAIWTAAELTQCCVLAAATGLPVRTTAV